jgi:hypothetical protein
VVAGGEVAGTWRARQKRTVLEITVEPFRPPAGADCPALDEEAGRIGRTREAARVRMQVR